LQQRNGENKKVNDMSASQKKFSDEQLRSFSLSLINRSVATTHTTKKTHQAIN